MAFELHSVEQEIDALFLFDLPIVRDGFVNLVTKI